MTNHPRLRRLFHTDGKCFDVALDHGVFHNAAPVEEALRHDAVALVVNLFHAPGQTELYRQCLANIAAVKPECERYRMPLMIEPLVLEPGRRDDYESSG